MHLFAGPDIAAGWEMLMRLNGSHVLDGFRATLPPDPRAVAGDRDDDTKIRCDLANMVRNAAGYISQHGQSLGYDFSLRELGRHVQQVRDGTATLDQFADLYMLRPNGGR